MRCPASHGSAAIPGDGNSTCLGDCCFTADCHSGIHRNAFCGYLRAQTCVVNALSIRHLEIQRDQASFPAGPRKVVMVMTLEFLFIGVALGLIPALSKLLRVLMQMLIQLLVGVSVVVFLMLVVMMVMSHGK